MQSGITDQYIYFVAVDSTDYVTRKTGLTAFTVYRSRNNGAATAYTSPTIAEVSAANMPGVYTLLLDEDMTIDAGDDSQEICYHITCATMAPITRTIELYRPIVTAGSTITVANGAADADIERIQGTVVNTPSVAGVLEVDVTHFNGTAGTFSAGRPEVNTTHAAGTAWGSGAITAASIATGAITNAKFAAGAIDAAAIATDAIGAAELAADALTEIRSLASGTSDSGTTTTMVDAARTEADTDYWKGSIIVFTSGNLLGQARLITGFTPGTDTITYAPATTQAAGTHTYEIWPNSAVDVQQWLQTTVSTPTVAGVPNVNCKTWNDLTTVALPLVPTTAGRTLDVSTTGEAGIDWANIGSPTTAQNLSATNIDVDQVVASVSGAVGSVTGAVGSISAGGIAAASFAAGAIDAAAIATGAIDADALAADASAEIADAVWDEDATAHQTQGTFGQAIGDPGADSDTIWALANTNLDAAISSRMASYTQPSGFLAATFPAGTIANTTNITAGTITTSTNVTTVNGLAANVITAASIATDAIDADALAADAVTEIRSLVSGTADSGTTTTMVDAARTEADTDYWKGALIVFTSGSISGQVRLITAFTPGSDTITFTPATTQAVGTNTYEIWPNSAKVDVQYVNNVLVNGDGSGTPWGP